MQDGLGCKTGTNVLGPQVKGAEMPGNMGSTDGLQGRIAATLADQPEKIDFVEVRNDQVEMMKLINKYFYTNGIKDHFGKIIEVNAKNVEIYYDEESGEKRVIASDGIYYHYFREENGKIVEISLIPDKVKEYGIRLIKRIGNYLCVMLNDGGIFNATRYYLDNNGNYIQELGEQTGKERFEKNLYGVFEYRKKTGENEETCIIYNRKMDKIAEFKDDRNKGEKYKIQYCDDKICVCRVEIYGKQEKYVVFNENEIVGEWMTKTQEESFFMNFYGVYEYRKKTGENEETCIIYNRKMDKIAEFKDDRNKGEKYKIQYCDDKICVCRVEIYGKQEKYVVFNENEIVGEGMINDLESDLKNEECMRGYFEYKRKIEEDRKRESIPFEERFFDINHCKIVYNNEEKTDISIVNDKNEVLFQKGNLKSFSFYRNPVFYGDDGQEFEIKNRESDSNVLHIEICGNSVFINKSTGDIKEGNKSLSSSMHGKIIVMFYSEEEANLYDDNFNYLGYVDKDDKMEYHNMKFFFVKKEENGNINYYIVSERTGESTQISRIGIPYANCYSKDGRTYLVVYTPGGGRKQVEVG